MTELQPAPARRAGGAPRRPAGRAAAPHVGALLAYLAITGRRYPRSMLTGLLAGDASEEQAQKRVSNTLADLRAAVGEHLQVTRQWVAFDRERPHWIDVSEFEAQVAAREEPRAAAGPRRRSTCTGASSSPASTSATPREFDEWLVVQRERLRLSLIQALQAALKGHLRSGPTSGRPRGDRAARRLLELEPWSEDGHQALMVLLARSGQRVRRAEAVRRLPPGAGGRARHRAPAGGRRAGRPAARAPRAVPAQPAGARRPVRGTAGGAGAGGRPAGRPGLPPGHARRPGGQPGSRRSPSRPPGASSRPGRASASRCSRTACSSCPSATRRPTRASRRIPRSSRAARIGAAVGRAVGVAGGADGAARGRGRAPALQEGPARRRRNGRARDGGGGPDRAARQSAGVTLLVTSRTRLRLPEETVCDVRGLFVPAGASDLERSDAGRFFLEAAARARPEAPLGPAECGDGGRGVPPARRPPPGAPRRGRLPARPDLRRPAGRPRGRAGAPGGRDPRPARRAPRPAGRCWTAPGPTHGRRARHAAPVGRAPRPLLAGGVRRRRRRVAQLLGLVDAGLLHRVEGGGYAMPALVHRYRGCPQAEAPAAARRERPSPSSAGDVPAGDPGTATAAAPARLARGAAFG